MKTKSATVAISISQDRVAPVFDVASLILLIEPGAEKADRRTILAYEAGHTLSACSLLRSHSVGTLICGAVSRQSSSLLAAYEIETIDFIAGSVEEILEAWRRGEKLGEQFAMPGCGRGRGGRGRGRGRGSGQGGRRLRQRRRNGAN